MRIGQFFILLMAFKQFVLVAMEEKSLIEYSNDFSNSQAEIISEITPKLKINGYGDASKNFTKLQKSEIVKLKTILKATVFIKKNGKTKQKYHCPLCTNFYQTKNSVKVHLQSNHSEDLSDLPYCAACKKYFTQPSSLKHHYDTIHGNQAFTCECGTVFKEIQALERHKKEVHLGVKEFVCNDCNEAFSRNATLKEHQKIHADVKDIICGFEGCVKTFRYKTQRSQHIKMVHKKIKNFTCQTCGRSFGQACQLQRHQAVHTGEKKYVCDGCDKNYSHPGSLSKHKKKCKNRKE